jgi:hypothetical protein
MNREKKVDLKSMEMLKGKILLKSHGIKTIQGVLRNLRG